MKRQAKNRIVLLLVIAGCLLCSSACVLFVPMIHNHSALTILCSSAFWGFLIIGYGLLWMINWKRRKQMKKGEKRRIGIITFFRNPPAKMMDFICLAGILILIISSFAAPLQGYLQYVLSFLVIFSFHMHCILNGEIFRYMQTEIRSCLE